MDIVWIALGVLLLACAAYIIERTCERTRERLLRDAEEKPGETSDPPEIPDVQLENLLRYGEAGYRQKEVKK